MIVMKYIFSLIGIIFIGYSGVYALQPKEDSQGAYIEVIYDKPQQQDTITLTIWDVPMSYQKRHFTSSRELKTVMSDNKFSFAIDSLLETAYFTLSRSNGHGERIPFLEMNLISPTDSIIVHVEDTRAPEKEIITEWGSKSCNQCEDFSFSGRGIAKYQCLQAVKKAESNLYDSYVDTLSDTPPVTIRLKNQYDRFIEHVLKGKLAELAKFEDTVPAETFQLIRADVIAESALNWFSIVLLESKYEDSTSTKEIYESLFEMFSHDIQAPSLSAQLKSAKYPEMLLYKTYIESGLYPDQSRYDKLKNEFDGWLLERLLTNYLLNNSSVSQFDSLANDALNVVHYPPYRQALTTLLSSQQIGTIAYDFALPDSVGDTVHLSDFLGKVVFIDFWFTGCGGCSEYYASVVSIAKERFKANPEVVFVSVSIDRNKEIWHRGLASGLYTSPDAVNLYTGDQGIRHPIIQQFAVASYPHPLLLGARGEVVSNDENELRRKGPEGLIATINKALDSIR